MAGQGLEVYGPTGVLELSITDRITRVLGTVSATGGTAGSVTTTGLDTGTPFWWVSKDGTSAFFATEPSISVSGTTLSWTWPNGGAGTFNITYGVY